MAQPIEAEWADGGEGGGQEIQLTGGETRQMVRTQYTTAMTVQHPRDLKQVERSVMQEAELLGEDAFYRWGEGKDAIIGPSKHLANALVRCYGNCVVDMGQVQETVEAWIFTAMFVDLQTGFSLTRQFRMSKKFKIHGKHDEFRKDDIRFQIGQTKACRNVVLNALPQWLVARAMDRAMGGVRELIVKLVADNGIEKVISKALARLGDLGVPQDRVLQAMGRELPGALTIDDLVILKAAAAALASGADTIEGLFPVKEKAEEPKTIKDRAAEAAKAKEQPKANPAPEPTPEPAAGTPRVSVSDIDDIFGDKKN